MAGDRVRISSVVFSAALLVSPESAFSIVSGIVDTQHQAVGAVVTDSGYCTGTLIRSDPPIGIVLTSASCIESFITATFSIFADDFDSTDTSAWSGSTGGL